jgi:hypothetical protein
MLRCWWQLVLFNLKYSCIVETLLPHLHGWPPAGLTAHRTGYVRGICARVETGFPKYIMYNFSSRRKCQQRKLVPPCSVPATRCSPWYPRYSFKLPVQNYLLSSPYMYNCILYIYFSHFSVPINLFFKPCSILPRPWYPSGRIYRPTFRENKAKTLVFEVYKFGHRAGKTLHFMHIHNRKQYFARASELNSHWNPMSAALLYSYTVHRFPYPSSL